MKRIYLASPHMSDEGYEKEYIREAFDTNWIAPLGPNVDGFEQELALRVGTHHAAALSSGTASVHLALQAAGVTAGDLVFCQSLTFAASANPIVYLGAKPVFIDSTERTWNMDPAALKDAFKKYRPKAVVVVHLYGMSAEMDDIIALCRENGVALVEDAAESLGTLYKGRATGTFGDYGIFSFNGNKIITTSCGGAVVSEDAEMIQKIRFWATQSRDPAPYYQHSELGYNYRMSNVLAGIGRGQLKVLDQRIEKKRAIYAFYKKELSDLDGIGFMPENEWDATNRWLSCVTSTGAVTPTDIRYALEQENIESRPIWKPLHLQPVFSGCDFVGGNVAERIFADGICLPSDTKTSEDELHRITSVIRSLWSR